MFNCSKCGLCCKQISKIPMFADLLDTEKGICKYFDEATNLCTIYDHRPVFCNVDESYRLFFSKKYSLKEYYEINYNACKNLQMNGEDK